jgi:hypothetical protein
MKAVVIRTDNSKQVVEFTNDTSYKTLSEAVGGYIECVYLHNRNLDLWLNEEGKITGLPVNPKATGLWMEMYGLTDMIVGDVIITGTADEEGYTTGLTDEEVTQLLEL